MWLSASTCPLPSPAGAAAAASRRSRTLSDYKDRSFGLATGTFIEELALLARAVFIVDRDGKVVYAEVVPEVADHPDYEAVFAKLRELI